MEASQHDVRARGSSVLTAAPAQAGGRKRRKKRPDPARFDRQYPFTDGDMVVVELVGSRNGANAAQLGTLDSLKLRKRGTVATVCYREQTTPGMLHRVRHLIEVRPHNNETFL